MSQFVQREFLYLDDAMAHIENTCKCFQMLAGHCQLPAARQACQSIGQMHQTHYQRLLRHLQSAQGAQQASSQQFAYASEYQNLYPGATQNWSGNRNI